MISLVDFVRVANFRSCNKCLVIRYQDLDYKNNSHCHFTCSSSSFCHMLFNLSSCSYLIWVQFNHLLFLIANNSWRYRSWTTCFFLILWFQTKEFPRATKYLFTLVQYEITVTSSILSHVVIWYYTFWNVDIKEVSSWIVLWIM